MWKVIWIELKQIPFLNVHNMYNFFSDLPIRRSESKTTTYPWSLYNNSIKGFKKADVPVLLVLEDSTIIS